MSEDVGPYAKVLVLQSFIGTLTACLQNLDQSRWKTVANIFFICLYLLEALLFVASLILYGHVTAVSIATLLLGYAVIQYVLIAARVDHRPKMSVVLNLQAAEELLLSVGVEVKRKDAFVVLHINAFLTILLFCLLGIVILTISPSIGNVAALGVTKYVTTFHFVVALYCELMLYMLIAHQIISMKQTIKENIHSILADSGVDPFSLGFRRRRTRLSYRKWTKLRTLERVLSAVTFEEHRSHEYFWPFLMIHCLHICFLTGSHIYLLFVSHGITATFPHALVMTCVSMAALNFLIVLVLKGVSLERERGLILGFAIFSSRIRGRGTGRDMKLQTLSRIHRRPPTICGIIRADYFLVSTVVDTIVLILTTLFAD